jgi:hypothetical protein
MMNDMAGWIWPVVAVVIGLGLGVMIGALRQRGGRHDHAPARDSGGQDHGPISMLPAGEGGREGTPQQRLLERLRATNLQLNAQLKSLAESNSRQAQEREAERQSDKLRQERELEELRQAHAGELSHLMNTLVEQVDGLNKQHNEQIKQIETELERARQDGRRQTTSSPGSLGGGSTRPAPMAVTPPPAKPGSAAGAVPDGPPSDYSVTLPMESFKER